MVYGVVMSLNVKNAETVRLVATLARRLNTTQVQAINEAVTARLADLDKPSLEVDAILTAIWAAQTPAEVKALRERQAALYDAAGLPA